ncbi:formate/nitrite transporter family protein [Phaeobacter sp. HF9A]|nr:formate/nitrite transporter family protein [Phaeobacter sp. HF9A]NIZ14449.1 formate/nitrite transporter family protein [Phaeobacter sp. HF9A]
MSYLKPHELADAMVDTGANKANLSTKDTLIRAYMAGAILALAAGFAVTVTVNTGNPLIGALLFPVGFCMLSLPGPLEFLKRLYKDLRKQSCREISAPGTWVPFFLTLLLYSGRM